MRTIYLTCRVFIEQTYSSKLFRRHWAFRKEAFSLKDPIHCEANRSVVFVSSLNADALKYSLHSYARSKTSIFQTKSLLDCGTPAELNVMKEHKHEMHQLNIKTCYNRFTKDLYTSVLQKFTN